MGNCLGKSSKMPAGRGQRLGSRPSAGESDGISMANMTLSAQRPTTNSSVPGPNAPRAGTPIIVGGTPPPADAEERRQRAAEAAAKRAQNDKSRGMQAGGGALAAKLDRERQLSTREAAMQANASSSNTAGGLSWVVDS
ncbi:hypothetical protein GGF31_005623 [Allomyces arbusculus]|nr:hypothetical protein GGF31_005623 [Allomyces arbusculus]